MVRHTLGPRSIATRVANGQLGDNLAHAAPVSARSEHAITSTLPQHGSRDLRRCGFTLLTHVSGFGGLPEPTEIEMMVDAGHVATLEAAIAILSARYTATTENRERWDHALAKARGELARWRRSSPPRIVLG